MERKKIIKYNPDAIWSLEKHHSLQGWEDLGLFERHPNHSLNISIGIILLNSLMCQQLFFLFLKQINGPHILSYSKAITALKASECLKINFFRSSLSPVSSFYLVICLISLHNGNKDLKNKMAWGPNLFYLKHIPKITLTNSQGLPYSDPI